MLGPKILAALVVLRVVVAVYSHREQGPVKFIPSVIEVPSLEISMTFAASTAAVHVEIPPSAPGERPY
jgi:hypothetical protein